MNQAAPAMSHAIVFWVLWLISLIFLGWSEFIPAQPYPYKRGLGYLILFALLGLLGWNVFGPLL